MIISRNGKTIVCDLDGVLCDNRRISLSKKKPFKNAIKMINQLYFDGYNIIIHTSRDGKYDLSETVDWLKKNKVNCCRLIFDKPKGDIYIDDKMVKSVKEAYNMFPKKKRKSNYT